MAQASSSHRIARNTFYNLITQGILVIIAIWSLPKIVHGLSQEEFGLLSLIWVFVGYFALLDFGISRANTKYLAEALAVGDRPEICRIVWTSISITSALGIIGAVIVLGLTPFLVHHEIGRASCRERV